MAQTLGSHEAGTSTRVAGAGTTRWQKVVGVLGLLVVVWVGSNLFDVVTSSSPGGPGSHAPSGQTPPGEVTGNEDPPPSDSPHDPSQFNH